MRIAMFYHSLISDWNHGNAHFLRGVACELQARGHEVRVFEPRKAWSVENLIRDHGVEPIRRFHAAYPGLRARRYELASLDLDEALEGVDLVLAHEWNDPELVRRLGEHRARVRGYRLFFHDTHHRMVSAPAEMSRYDLRHYDGVLAFGQVIADLYRSRGLAQNAWTWHEAADTRIFRPGPVPVSKPLDLVWIGNWGDDERTEELQEFLVDPVRELGLRAEVHGVRYPEIGIRRLSEAGIKFRGWVPNFRAPEVFSQAKLTIHVPRKPYVQVLPGIPTIRVFEALACGIPLISAHWLDSEGLFTPGEDFLVARDGFEMRRQMKKVLWDQDLARALSQRGLKTLLSRHTCAHRVDELLGILERSGERLMTGVAS